MMPFPGDDDVLLMFIVASLRGGVNDPICSDDLLVGITSTGPAAAILEAVELTPTVARTVSRHQRGTWSSTDAGGVGPDGPTELVMAENGEPAHFTPAAAEAMRRAAAAAAADGRPTCTPLDIARELLDDPDNRAVEMLTFCGVDIPALRQALRSGRPAVAPDRLDPELLRLRDVLLGRDKYPKPSGWRNWALKLAVVSRLNYAEHPLIWIRMEAFEQARRAGREQPGTDDVLLAVLATLQVARAYPHLSQPAKDRYNGAQALVNAGLRYRAAYEVAQNTDLGTDPQPLKGYLASMPKDTATLLRLILVGDNRATRLLTTLGVDPALLPLAG
jgi:hypothetical protein